MGVIGGAIKLIAIPIILVVLIAFIIFVFRYKKRRDKKRDKDIEQAADLQPFNYPPPSYGGSYPAKPPTAVVHSHPVN